MYMLEAFSFINKCNARCVGTNEDEMSVDEVKNCKGGGHGMFLQE